MTGGNMAQAKTASDLLPIMFNQPRHRLGCHVREEYDLVRRSHRWQQRAINSSQHYEYREYLCKDCNTRLDVVLTERRGTMTPAVIQATNKYLSKWTWQIVDGRPETCSHQTYLSVFQALLDRAMMDHGVRRRGPDPEPRDETPRPCEERFHLPAVAYPDIADQHELDEEKRDVWTTRAGSIATTRCIRCDATVTEIQFDDDTPSTCVIRGSRYGPSQAWQRVGKAMEPTNIETADAVLRAYTALERLRQIRAGVRPEYRRTILRPSWNTAMEDLIHAVTTAE